MLNGKVRSYSSGILFRTAIQAYERIGTLDYGENDAIVAILMSAASLEAYINELSELASSISTYEAFNDAILIHLTNVLSDLDKTSESTLLKIQFTKYILTNEAYDKGRQPFQDLDLLFQLRNSIIHLKPTHDIKKDKLIKSLESKKILDTLPDGFIVSWLSRISTKAVARWSINTVLKLTEDIKQNIIDSSIKSGEVKSFLVSNFCCFEKVL